MTILIIFAIIWIAGSIIAYPFHKRFRIKELGDTKDGWTRGSLINCFLVSFCLWWGILLWVAISKVEDFFTFNNWLNKKSKL